MSTLTATVEDVIPKDFDFADYDAKKAREVQFLIASTVNEGCRRVVEGYYFGGKDDAGVPSEPGATFNGRLTASSIRRYYRGALGLIGLVMLAMTGLFYAVLGPLSGVMAWAISLVPVGAYVIWASYAREEEHFINLLTDAMGDAERALAAFVEEQHRNLVSYTAAATSTESNKAGDNAVAMARAMITGEICAKAAEYIDGQASRVDIVYRLNGVVPSRMAWYGAYYQLSIISLAVGIGALAWAAPNWLSQSFGAASAAQLGEPLAGAFGFTLWGLVHAATTGVIGIVLGTQYVSRFARERDYVREAGNALLFEAHPTARDEVGQPRPPTPVKAWRDQQGLDSFSSAERQWQASRLNPAPMPSVWMERLLVSAVDGKTVDMVPLILTQYLNVVRGIRDVGVRGYDDAAAPAPGDPSHLLDRDVTPPRQDLPISRFEMIERRMPRGIWRP